MRRDLERPKAFMTSSVLAETDVFACGVALCTDLRAGPLLAARVRNRCPCKLLPGHVCRDRHTALRHGNARLLGLPANTLKSSA